MRGATRIVDPAIAALALLTTLALLVIQEGPELAAMGGVSALFVGIVAERLARPPAPPATPPQAKAIWYSPLTPRECDVALLVGTLTNKEIATRLGIVERSVETHVNNIFNKLDRHHRAEIALWIADKQRQADTAGAAPAPPRK